MSERVVLTEDTEPSTTWMTPGVAGIGTASLLADVGHEIPTALLPSLLTSTLKRRLCARAHRGGQRRARSPASRVAPSLTTPIAGERGRRRLPATAILAAGTGGDSGLAGRAAAPGRGRHGGCGPGATPSSPTSCTRPPTGGHTGSAGHGQPRRIGGPLLAIGLVATVGTRWGDRALGDPGVHGRCGDHLRHPAHPRPQGPRARPDPPAGPPRAARWARSAVRRRQRSRSATAPPRSTSSEPPELLEPGHGTDSATTIALGLYVTYNAAATLTSLAAGGLSDRRTARPALVFGVAAFAVAYLGLHLRRERWRALLPWFLAAGVASDSSRPPSTPPSLVPLRTSCAARHSVYSPGSRASATSRQA